MTDATVCFNTFLERAFVCILGHSKDTIVILPHRSNHTYATKLIRQTGGLCARHARNTSWLTSRSVASTPQEATRVTHRLATRDEPEALLGPDRVLICRQASSQWKPPCVNRTASSERLNRSEPLEQVMGRRATRGVGGYMVYVNKFCIVKNIKIDKEYQK